MMFAPHTSLPITAQYHCPATITPTRRVGRRTGVHLLISIMLVSRRLPWAVIVLGLIVGLPAFVYFVIFDHQNEPFCHKLVFLVMSEYLDDKKTDALPNVNGRSSDSINSLLEELGDQPWAETYRYVPGLKKGDPGDLVLMYMPVPTRYVLHYHASTIFAEKKWILIPLDFCSHAFEMGAAVVNRDIPFYGEECERVSLEELQSRLKKTLDYLRENNRPNWQTVVAEHEKFLDSVKSHKQ
jgi:hypothetical protein